jgi:hypothetical protein
MVPSAVWIVRKRKGVLLSAGVYLVLTFAGMIAMLQWWKHQPYALIEPLTTHIPLASWARYLILPAMELIVLLAPALSLFLARRVPEKVYAVSVTLALLAPLALMRNPYDLLRLANHDIFGDAPQWVFLIALAYSFGLLPIAVRTVHEALAGSALLTTRGEISFRALTVLIVPFALAIFLVADSRESFFARYLLPALAALTIWLIKLWSDLRPERPGCGIAAPVVAAIYCAFIVIQMHDLFRYTATVLSLTQWYASQDMPRDQLEAGFAFDGWYQVQLTGYINEHLIKVPADAYVNRDLPLDIAACHNFFLPYTPSIHPVYGVDETLSSCFEGPVLYSIEYAAWMAPHRRVVFIARYAPKYAMPAR